MSRTRLVFIEDHSDNRELISLILETWYDVQSYGDGISGLTAIRESRPDAVLLDVGMPEMDGFAVLREIRADPELRNLPVIAITAHVMPSDRERQLAAGFDDQLPKPILDNDELYRHIERTIAAVKDKRNRFP